MYNVCGARRSQEYFIDVQRNLETLNHDLSVETWDLTTPWSGACEGITSTTILATVGAVSSVGLPMRRRRSQDGGARRGRAQATDVLLDLLAPQSPTRHAHEMQHGGLTPDPAASPS